MISTIGKLISFFRGNFDFFIVFLFKILSAFSVFIYQRELAYLWSPEDLGVFSSNLGIVMFVAAISNWGKSKGIIRVKSLNLSNEEIRYLVRFSLVKILTVSFLLVAIGYAVAKLILGITVLPLVLVIPLASCSYFFADYYKSQNDPIRSVLSWSVLLNISFLITVFSFSNVSLEYMTMSMAIAQILLFVMFLYGGNISTQKYGNNDIIRQSFVTITNDLGWNQIYEEIIRWTPLLILGVVDLKGAAMFTVAQKFAFIIYLVLSVINTIIPGRITDLIKRNQHAEALGVIRSAQNGMLVVGIVIAVFSFFGSDILLGFFGDYYRVNGRYVLTLLMIGAVLHGYSDIRLLYFQISGMEKIAKKVSRIVAIFQGITLPISFVLGGLNFLCGTIVISIGVKVVLLHLSMKDILEKDDTHS